MKMKFAIIEITSANHQSLLRNWTLYLEKNGIAHEVFVDSRISSNIKEIEDFTVFQMNRWWASNFVKKLHSEKFTHVIFTTVQVNLIQIMLFSFLAKRLKVYLTVHNAKAWFSPEYKFSVKLLVKTFLRKLTKTNINKFFVCSSNLKKYIEETRSSKQDIYVMPFMLYEKSDSIQERRIINKNSKFRICIPGVVTEKRKSYDKYLRLIAEHQEEYSLLLLGRIDTKSVSADMMHKLKELKENGAEIDYFTEYLSAAQFEKGIFSSDMISAEVVVEYDPESDSKEIYGKTKDTGVSYNMIRYSKPGLFNADFTNLSELQTSTVTYDSYENMLKVLKKLRAETTFYNDLVNSAVRNSEKFNIDCLELLESFK